MLHTVNDPRTGPDQPERQSPEDDMLAAPERRPAPPPPAVRVQRTHLHTRIRTDIDDVMRRYAAEHATTHQLIVEAALIEYFTARGLWPSE